MLEDTNFDGRSVRIWNVRIQGEGRWIKDVAQQHMAAFAFSQEGRPSRWFLFPFSLAFPIPILPGHFFLPISFTLLNSPERIHNSSLPTYLFISIFACLHRNTDRRWGSFTHSKSTNSSLIVSAQNKGKKSERSGKNENEWNKMQ